MMSDLAGYSGVISEECLDETIKEQNELSRNFVAMIEDSLKIDEKSAKPKKKPTAGMLSKLYGLLFCTVFSFPIYKIVLGRIHQ